ncbi:MAG: hypothetical protein JWQ84_3622 [Mucilaginibacter sp.]|jgi:hypothetical protein|nr:hypothetical protein [Mucilaginibacter sp.]MDB5018790.1 hypothetical protein [Mucilaginibacter sp.]MDB5138827.1 hypothetical protein [Mucilaginibacter sp.]
MELILKSNNEKSLSKIIALAKKLDVIIEQRGKLIDEKIEKEEIIKRILNFKASTPPSFGDAAEWERNQREDRELPFSK